MAPKCPTSPAFSRVRVPSGVSGRLAGTYPAENHTFYCFSNGTRNGHVCVMDAFVMTNISSAFVAPMETMVPVIRALFPTLLQVFGAPKPPPSPLSRRLEAQQPQPPTHARTCACPLPPPKKKHPHTKGWRQRRHSLCCTRRHHTHGAQRHTAQGPWERDWPVQEDKEPGTGKAQAIVLEK